ncbi:1,4-beta-D-glucan glucohydrolase [Thermoflexales bacterium]|nr:1,4-beta-D-glucan glucohydrolase [Thermoflexales bacterium]
MPSLSHLLHPPPPPKTLLFGVAISDHQAEAYDDRFSADIWDIWERSSGIVPRGRGTDFWNRWEEDVLNAHELGCRAFRFSLAWARIEPKPGEFDAGALEHYRTIVLRLHELNMEPIVTLCHFVWPQHIEERGGLRSERFAQWFAAYTAQVRTALDPHVRYWLTFNEPNIVLQGFYRLWFQPDFSFPPGQPPDLALPDQIAVTIDVIRHLFEAHRAARRVLRREAGEHNLVSANVFQLGLPTFLQRLIDRNVTRLKQAEDWRDHFWRISERPTLLHRFDLIVAPVSTYRDDHTGHLATSGYDTLHFDTGLSALVKQAERFQTLNALDGQPLAMVRGASWDKVATVRARLTHSRLYFVETHAQAFELLDQGGVTAIVADQTVLHALARAQAIYHVFEERFNEQSYVVAVQTGNPALLDAVKHALNALHTEAGQQEMCRHYLPERASQPPHFKAQPRVSHYSGLGQVQERGKVIVGLQRADLPWIDLTHATPDRIGLDFDFGRALAGVIFGDPTCVEFRRAALPRPNTLRTRLSKRIDEWARAWTIFSTFVSSTWWYLGMQGQLPEYLCPRQCVGQLDFVSFDYYFGISAPTPSQLRRLARSVQRQFNRTAVWAGGLYQALQNYHARFPDLPIIIAENGFADEPASQHRGEQFAAHIQAVQRARAEGIDVRAYCVWSITSNREWGLPQEAASDFGLYYVDLDHDPELRRQATPSVEAYRQLIAKHGDKGST